MLLIERLCRSNTRTTEPWPLTFFLVSQLLYYIFCEPSFIYIYICGYGSRGRITHLWPVTQHRYITMSLGQEQVAKSEPTKAKERNENPNRRSQQLLKPLHLSMRHLRSLRHLRSFRHLRGLRSLGSGNDAWIRN